MPTTTANKYTWNPEAGRYVDARGRFVSRRAVVDALDYALERAKDRGRKLAAQLQAGQLSLRDWEQAMRVVVKDVHLYSAATARGGWAQMTFTDFGNVGPAVRFHYKRLNQFATEIAEGYKLDGRFLQRTELYLLSGRSSFHRQDEIVQGELGMTEERNLLAPADHCGGCRGETARGWVAIGTLIPPGQRDCLSRCKCFVIYRKPGEAD